MPRTTAGSRSSAPLTPHAARTAPASAPPARTGASRPSMRDVPGRPKQSAEQRGERRGVHTGGWAGYKKAKEERSAKYPRFEVDKDGTPSIIRFAQAEPFAFIHRHWVAKRPYTCIRDDENDVRCPLCDAATAENGILAKPVVFYNVIDLTDEARVKVWELTADPTRKVIKQYDLLADMEPARTLDDPGFYFAVSKSQKDRSAWEYEVERIKVRDLQEDWGAEPLGDDEFTEATEKLFDDSIIYVSSTDDLREAVEKIED